MSAPVSITGIGKCVPEKVVTNDDLSHLVETSDEWISKRERSFPGVTNNYAHPAPRRSAQKSDPNEPQVSMGSPVLHKEDLIYTAIEMKQRSYK